MKIEHEQLLETMLWSTTDQTSEFEPLDENYDISDIDWESIKSLCEDFDQFITDNKADIEEFMLNTGCDMEQVAHDFWLTSQGHGAGFWDRGAGVVGLRLTGASQVHSYHVFVQDEKIYIE